MIFSLCEDTYLPVSRPIVCKMKGEAGIATGNMTWYNGKEELERGRKDCKSFFEQEV